MRLACDFFNFFKKELHASVLFSWLVCPSFAALGTLEVYLRGVAFIIIRLGVMER